MGQQESPEVQRKRIQGPAPRTETPHAQVRGWILALGVSVSLGDLPDLTSQGPEQPDLT